MSTEQYWMGKDIDLDSLWHDFDSDPGFTRKVSGSRLYLLRLTFGNHPAALPLFDHEVIFKTVKGTFYDVKAECLSPAEYEAAGPIFLFRVDRGSGIYEFLAEFHPLITWLAALGSAALGYRKMLAMDQEFDEKRFDFLKKNFPNAKIEDRQAYMKAWTTFSRRTILHRLIGQDLERDGPSFRHTRSGQLRPKGRVGGPNTKCRTRRNVEVRAFDDACNTRGRVAITSPRLTIGSTSPC